MGVDNDHSVPPAHWSLEKYKFMPPPDLQLSCRDYQLVQPQQTLAYTKTLQYWAEKAQPPIPGKPNYLAGSVLELRWAMEPLVTFSDEEVLAAAVPSNWIEVTVPRLAEPTPVEPHCSCRWSCSHNTLAHPNWSLMAACGRDWPTVMKKRDEPAILPKEVMMQLPVPEHKSPCPPPGFVEIARSLWGKQPMDGHWCPCRKRWRVRL